MKIAIKNLKTGITEEKQVVAWCMSGDEVGQRTLLASGLATEETLKYYSGTESFELAILSDGSVLSPSDFSRCNGKILALDCGEETNPIVNRFFGGAYLLENVTAART